MDTIELPALLTVLRSFGVSRYKFESIAAGGMKVETIIELHPPLSPAPMAPEQPPEMPAAPLTAAELAIKPPKFDPLATEDE